MMLLPALVFVILAFAAGAKGDAGQEPQRIYEEIRDVITKLNQPGGLPSGDLAQLVNGIASDIENFLEQEGAEIDMQKVKELLEANTLKDEDGIGLFNAVLGDPITQVSVRLSVALALWKRLAEMLPQAAVSDQETLLTVLASIKLTSKVLVAAAKETEEVAQELSPSSTDDTVVKVTAENIRSYTQDLFKKRKVGKPTQHAGNKRGSIHVSGRIFGKRRSPVDSVWVRGVSSDYGDSLGERDIYWEPEEPRAKRDGNISISWGRKRQTKTK